MKSRAPGNFHELVRVTLPDADGAGWQAATYQLDCFLDVIDEIHARLSDERLLDAVLDNLRAGERVDRMQ